MAAKSLFLPRFSLARGRDSSLLPLHNSKSRPSFEDASEYDLSDLSPRPDHTVLQADGENDDGRAAFEEAYTLSDVATPRKTQHDGVGRATNPKMKSRVMFAGPPPPIAASSIMRPAAVETRGFSGPSVQGSIADEYPPARRVFKSVLFDETVISHDRRAVPPEPDPVWRSLQRRERALEEDIQQLLDIQASALALQLDPDVLPAASASVTPGSRSGAASDAGSSTPTGTDTFYSTKSAQRSPGIPYADSQAHSSIIQPARAWASGQVIPVRQPTKRRLGLRGARTALVRALVQLANLKAEEKTSLESALGARRTALAQLKRLATRRESVAGELHALETDSEEPLARNLRDLQAEHSSVAADIVELDEKLTALRRRKRLLEGRIEDVANRRDAGLSGYRGALREVDGQIAEMLRHPPVRPLDMQALQADQQAADITSRKDGSAGPDNSSSTVDFLQLRPDRRTLSMAKDWWDTEVELLESRKTEVDKDREAVEQGKEVWEQVVKLVSEFESSLRKELGREGGQSIDGNDKGKQPGLSPEEAMRAQLQKMATVITALDERLSAAETNGWNLLICAIGAELEAFREGERMLQQALGEAAGAEDTPTRSVGAPAVDDEMPRLAQGNEAGNYGKGLLDIAEAAEPESDNEVPQDLLVSYTNEQGNGGFPHQQDPQRNISREDSNENEVPHEFLAEQSRVAQDAA